MMVEPKVGTKAGQMAERMVLMRAVMTVVPKVEMMAEL